MTEGRRLRVEVRRVYEDIPSGEATRVLIDRLWPRGIAWATAPFDQWLREVAPAARTRAPDGLPCSNETHDASDTEEA